MLGGRFRYYLAHQKIQHPLRGFQTEQLGTLENPKGKEAYGAQAKQNRLQDTKATKEETTDEETNQVEQKTMFAQTSPIRQTNPLSSDS